ncbi:MAG: hypothetical protein NTY98_04440 [Verrucomicrobia bacterium]|nr:hypothetical protein [Verrucomicrobiota bacterium]
MKQRLRLLLALLAPLLLTFAPASAADAPGGVREFKDMLKDIPSKDLLKLSGNKKEEVAMEMSKQITLKELGKEGAYKGKIGSIEVWPFPDKGITGTRLSLQDTFKRGGDTIIVWAWVYIHTDPSGVVPKLKVGKEITVSGKVNRADLSITPAGPRLNVDLIVPAMPAQK